jgi:hypothetical protein
VTVSSRGVAIAGIAILIGMLIIGATPIQSSWRWVIIAILMVIFLALIGKDVNKRWTGILIDERKKMSLSRFQIIIWTVIIVSAFFTIAIVRIQAYAANPKEVVDPLAIGIPWELWALLGISSASLVGSPLIINEKKQRNPDQAKLQRKYNAAFANAMINSSEGIVAVNKYNSEAKFINKFMGDETGNNRHVDMSKVQMFFFTIISASSYAVLLFVMLFGTTIPKDLPVLPAGLLALLTISHGAYLTGKTVNHTPTS